MAKKISLNEIKKMLKSGTLVIGTKKSVKSLRLGKVEKIMLSSNCPAKLERDINYYAGLAGAEIHRLEYPNDELGVLCKKPFSISVLAFVKGASK